MNRNRNAVLALACLALTALGIVACGSGSGSGSSFADEANRSCMEAAKRRTAIFLSPVGNETNQKQAESAERQYLASGEKLVEEMKGLKPPQESRSAFSTYIEAGEKGVEREREIVKAVEANDRSEFGKLSKEEFEEGRNVTHLAAQVTGLDVCAQKMSPTAVKEVEKTIEDNETIADPAQCTEYVEPSYLKLVWKNMKGCRKFQSTETQKEIPDSVDVHVFEGVDGVRATAYVTFHGGSTDGQTAEFGMAYDEGRWKLAYAGPKQG